MKRRKKTGGKKKTSSFSKLSLFQKPGIKFFRPCPLSGKNAPSIDYKNIKLLKKYVKRSDLIIPLAGLVGAPLCEKNKKEAVETNFEQIKYILKYMNRRPKIIYMNSNSGYGIG